MIKLTTSLKKMKYLLLVLVFLGFQKSPVMALNQELQLGYVFDAWDSNFIFHGTESRIPFSYKLSGENFSIRLSTAFVLGSYQFDGTTVTSPGAFKSEDLSDTNLQGAIGIPMGGDLKSSVILNLNIPTGNTNWEANAAVGAIPYIFDSSYYHGRGLGGDAFYFLSSTSHDLRWGFGVGYLRTTAYYNSGILGSDTLTPWGALVAMGTVGFPVDAADDISFRLVQNIPFQADAQYALFPFTLGQSTAISAQWGKKLGRDKLQVTATYNRFNPGTFTDPISYSYVQESQAFLGNRLELHPFLGWFLQPGVTMESGLDWRHVFSNGYDYFNPVHEGGGDLLGAQQSITFQLDSGAFLNFAGLYQYIYNDASALNTSMNVTGVSYNRFTFGTNVGFKW